MLLETRAPRCTSALDDAPASCVSFTSSLWLQVTNLWVLTVHKIGHHVGDIDVLMLWDRLCGDPGGW
jgi:hypothetical protein